jgi:hypothetical protein
VIAAAALGLAAGAFAQQTQTKEAVPAGPATIQKTQLQGELVAVGPSWIVAKMTPSGEYRVFNVKAGQKFTIDGVPKTLKQLQPGTMLTGDVTITETPMVKRTTTVNQGTVFWASPSSVIITQKNGENRQYAVPADFKFTVEGKQVSAMELRPGMKVTGTKIVEEPINMISRNTVVTGTAPK